MAVSETELLPCPFCGYAAMESGNPSDKHEPSINIHCSDCDAEGGWFYGNGCCERAAKHWNTRASTAALSDQVVEWRPIEAAPRDGKDHVFDISFKTRAYWEPELKRWVMSHPLKLECLPSHAKYLGPAKALFAPPQPSEDNGPDTNGARDANWQN